MWKRKCESEREAKEMVLKDTILRNFKYKFQVHSGFTLSEKIKAFNMALAFNEITIRKKTKTHATRHAVLY